jgi:hypothetical protein
MEKMLEDWLLLAGATSWVITGYTWNPLFSTLTVKHWNGSAWVNYFRSYAPPAAPP